MTEIPLKALKSKITRLDESQRAIHCTGRESPVFARITASATVSTACTTPNTVTIKCWDATRSEATASEEDALGCEMDDSTTSGMGVPLGLHAPLRTVGSATPGDGFYAAGSWCCWWGWWKSPLDVTDETKTCTKVEGVSKATMVYSVYSPTTLRQQ